MRATLLLVVLCLAANCARHADLRSPCFGRTGALEVTRSVAAPAHVAPEPDCVFVPIGEPGP